MIHTHNFIYAHLRHAIYGLLFHFPINDTFFVAVRQGRIEISKFNYEFRWPVWTSCNGLILEFEFLNPHAIYVANPATKQNFVLPPFYLGIPRHDLSGIAYAAASMEYKVVVTYASDAFGKQKCAILTVGVDNSWRNICTEHLSLTDKKVFRSSPLIAEGFVHWVMGGTHVWTLEVETEVIREASAAIPQVYGGQMRKYYMSTGSYLSLLITSKKFSWEVWETKPETGEWRKLPNIALEAQKRSFEQFGLGHDECLVPVAWLKYPDVLVFCISGQSFILYSLLTQEIDSFESPRYCKRCNFLVHRNSLVSFGGC